MPYSSIVKVVSEGGGFPAVVFTLDGREKMHLRDRDFVMLAKTILNQWTVDGERIEVLPGKEGQEARIIYRPVGRYQSFWLETLLSCIVFLAIPLLFFSSYEERVYNSWITGYIGFGLMILAFFFSFFAGRYKKVQVLFEPRTLRIKEDNETEQVISLDDVSRVEIGFFRITIIAKNGQVFKVPRACVLLPQLIGEFV